MTAERLQDYCDIKRELEHLERLRARLQEEARRDEARGWIPKGQRSKSFYAVVALYDRKIKEARAELQAVEAFINTLPDQCREVCRLHYLEGRTMDEAAEAMCYSCTQANRYKKKALACL